MAAGSMEFLADGAWTKRIHPGLAAQNGIHAALLAAEGFTGPLRILEGRDGFLHGYSRNPVPDRLTDGLGESFEILHTAVKPHACCRYMQGPIDAILAIMREQKLDASQIGRIEVAVLEAGWGIVAEPRAKKYNPESVVDAQFSMPFGAAVAAIDGAAGLDQFTVEKARSPKIRELMGKVALVKDPRIEGTFPQEWPARVDHRTGRWPALREVRPLSQGRSGKSAYVGRNDREISHAGRRGAFAGALRHGDLRSSRRWQARDTARVVCLVTTGASQPIYYGPSRPIDPKN